MLTKVCFFITAIGLNESDTFRGFGLIRTMLIFPFSCIVKRNSENFNDRLFKCQSRGITRRGRHERRLGRREKTERGYQSISLVCNLSPFFFPPPPSHLHHPNCFLNYLKQSFVFNYFGVKGNEVFSFRKIDVSIGLLSAESSMNYCECKKYCLMIICGNRVTSYHLKWHLSGNSNINVACIFL